jgi:alpha-tubulin suppressor-like RCC1 family protein
MIPIFRAFVSRPAFALALAAALLLPGQGCRTDAEPPTAVDAESSPAAAVAAAGALVFRQISAGGAHSCGVTIDNRAYCWGEGRVGALGDGREMSSTSPVPVAGNLLFLRVNAGDAYTCGLTIGHKVYCWGDNAFGNLGDGTHFRRLTPVAATGGHRFTRLDAGDRHICAVTGDDRAFCWGDNTFGELGIGNDTGPEFCAVVIEGPCSTRPIAVAGARRFRQVSAGTVHTCGVATNGHAFCWGAGVEGRPSSLKPTRVDIARNFRLVRAGGSHDCGVTTGDQTFCWGAGEVGQLGNGQATSSATPVRVAGGRAFAGLSADDRYTCGIAIDDRAFCWGDNEGGQLGRGTLTGPEQCAPAEIPCSTRPLAVVGGLLFKQLDAGAGHTCGVTTDGRGFCWGVNFAGQLGNGSDTGPESCGEFAPCSSGPVAVVAPRL